MTGRLESEYKPRERAPAHRAEASQTDGENLDAGAKSKIFQVELLTPASCIVRQDRVDEALELGRMIGGGADPPLVLIQLVEKKSRKPILFRLGDRSQLLDRLFHESRHGREFIRIPIPGKKKMGQAEQAGGQFRETLMTTVRILRDSIRVFGKPQTPASGF